MKGEDILKRGNKGTRPNKVKGNILRPLVIEHLEETGYKDYYILDNVFEEIYPKYLALHHPMLHQHRNRRGKFKALEEKVLLTLAAYFPSPYVSRQVNKNSIRYRLAVKENIDLKNFGKRILKQNYSKKKSSKIRSEIVRPLVIEYLEKTGYKDYYFFKDVFEEIYPKYLALHREAVTGKAYGSIIEDRINQFLIQYFPSPYKPATVGMKGKMWRMIVNENVDIKNIKTQMTAMLESKMSKAYDPKPPKKVTPDMEEDIDYVTGENEYENNPTLSQKIKQILSLKPIPYSPKKPKKEDVDKEDNCGCNSCNDVSKGKKKSSKCTGRTKKTSSKVKGKKWTQCVPTGEKGKYRRANWGQAGVKVTGDSGNTKRKKSFRARHKCKTCKLDNGPKRYYSNQCLACRDW